MNKTIKRAIATAAMVLAAFTAQADSRGRHDERHWRGDSGHYVRDHREHRGGRGWRRGDDRRGHGYRQHRRDARQYWSGYHDGRHHSRYDRHYRGGYRGDRVYYGRDTYADLDVVIHVPLW